MQIHPIIHIKRRLNLDPLHLLSLNTQQLGQNLLPLLAHDIRRGWQRGISAPADALWLDALGEVRGVGGIGEGEVEGVEETSGA